MKSVAITIPVILLSAAALPVFAQGGDVVNDRPQAELRYQIGQMERVLEGAVEHGAKVWRDRFQSVMPADMLLSENAKVRGFRLEGYGVLFDVEVPSLETAPLWSFQTLDQNDLGLVSALESLRSFVGKAGDVDVQQALKRVELQVAPAPGSAASDQRATRVANLANAASPAQAVPGVDPGTNPQEAYRTDVKTALMEAMLDYSRGLDVAPGEWLSVAARSIDERPPLASADSDATTVIIRVRGADLTAFLGGQITRDEAKSRMEVRVF